VPFGGGVMETRAQWAGILKHLRETHSPLAPVVQNLNISFTPELIIVHASNPSVFKILSKYKAELPENVQIQFAKRAAAVKSIEQKLVCLFGDKLEIEVQ
jgi:hypothetical protein